LAHSSRTWTGARSPQGKKRVRQSARRHAVLQPRRSAAKTHVKSAVAVAASGDAEATQAAMIAAISALDRAAKVGAIHPNAAARRKSRLVNKINAALGGDQLVAAAKATRQTGKAAAAKAAKARIAAGRATKAKGEQTAAGKARAALSRSSREAAATTAPTAETESAARPAARTSTKVPASRSTTTKAATKSTASRPSSKTSTSKSKS
jgi:small subunit ribosomal protein S20